MTSLKKLIAVLAVSLPLAASAQQAAPAAAAPAPLYQWYGTLNLNFQWTEASRPLNIGAGTVSVGARTALSTDSSNVGIRGTADTGQYGLGVVYQCESSANIDGQGIAGICGRNSRIGLTGDWGTLFYGNWDTPFKAVWYGTKGDDAFGNTDVYDAAGIMGSPGVYTKSSAGASAGPATVAAATFATSSTTYNIRAANSVVYHSPKFMGAQLKAQYSANEFASPDNRVAPALYSLALNYDRGPLSVFGAVERHDDYFGLNQILNSLPAGTGGAITPVAGSAGTKSTVDYGYRVGAGYEVANPFGTTTVGGVYEYLTYQLAHTAGVANGTIKELNRSSFMVNVKHRMGNHEFRARYEYADGLTAKYVGTGPGLVGLGATNYAVGYAYYLSKAAQVYAFFTKIENERNATYTFATAGNPAVTGLFTRGADPEALGLGLRYAF